MFESILDIGKKAGWAQALSSNICAPLYIDTFL